jgi:hypothetical protein
VTGVVPVFLLGALVSSEGRLGLPLNLGNIVIWGSLQGEGDTAGDYRS